MKLGETQPRGDHLRIALLGDLHGHLVLAYRLLRAWEIVHGERFDLVLQVGDMGAYPDHGRLDWATLRFAERDPDELGYRAFWRGEESAARILGGDGDLLEAFHAPMLFVRGNHEDFEHLAELERGARDRLDLSDLLPPDLDLGARFVASPDEPCTVDPWGRLLYLPCGSVTRFTTRGLGVTVAALGGVDRPVRDPQAPDLHHTSNQARRLCGKASRGLDVLLSHQPAVAHGSSEAGRPEMYGSRIVRDVLATVRPGLHFCGHVHEEARVLPAPEAVTSWLLNEVGFATRGRLRSGSVGLLRWVSADAWSFEVLDLGFADAWGRDDYRELRWLEELARSVASEFASEP